MLNLPVVANNHSESLCLQTEDTCKNSKHTEDIVMQLHMALGHLQTGAKKQSETFPILNRGNSTPPSLFWTSHLSEILFLPYNLYLIL